MTTEDKSPRILAGHIVAGIGVLRRIENHLETFLEQQAPALGRTLVAAVVVADALSRYYTAAETVFFRIASFFENSLEGKRWHADLLDRMAIAIPGVRPAVLTSPTQAALRELMRFRHFSRYYVELDYDWDRLDFLLKKFRALQGSLVEELNRFQALVEDADRDGRENG